MARGKKKGGKRRGDDTDEEDNPENAQEEAPKEAGLSRKEKKVQKQLAKQQHKNKGVHDDEEEDAANAVLKTVLGGLGASDSDGEADVQPAKKLTKKQLKKQKEQEAAEARAQEEAKMDSESEEEEAEEEEETPQQVKKLTKKQLKKQKEREAAEARARAQEEAEMDSESEEEEEEEEEIPQPVKKLTKKQLKKQKEREAAEARTREEEEEDDDDDDEEEIPQPVKKLTKKQLKKQKKREAAEAHAREEEAQMDEDDDSEAEEENPQPVKKLTKKQLKKQEEREAAEARAREEEAQMDEDESEEGEEEIPQPFKKISKKQLKKQKKQEAAQALMEESSEEEEVADQLENLNIDDNEKDKKKKKEKKKSKLQKQMEEAMKKKEQEDQMEMNEAVDEEKKEALDDDESLDEEAKAKAARKAEKAARKAEKETKKAKKLAKKEKLHAEPEKEKGADKVEDNEDEVVYGAPDDKAWTDKSHAQIDAEKKAEESPDLSLIYGPDGKKLSNKERKRALKAKEAKLRAAEADAAAMKASAEGAQFACSQTAVNENDPAWENSLDVNIPSFNISAAGKVLFKDASLTIGHGRRYGLVGPNGKGKSTLLKMIASRDLILPPRIDFLYVEQEVVADDTPAVEAVLKADKKRWALLQEEAALTKIVDEGNEDAEVIDRLQKVFDKLSAMGGEDNEAKARRILYGLGFDVEMQTKPTKMFSGGWRMRISLARALFIEPTLLMLDEPTNHLDLNAVIWLDDYLQKWKKTLLVVSHDQDFLNSVCDEILHIEDLKLVSYKGNYDSFKRAEKTKLLQQIKAWEKQEKRLRELKRSGNSKAKATEAVKKASKREPGSRSQKKKNDAIASGTATAEKQELIKRPREYHVRLEFTEVAELSRPVMEVNNVHFRYSPKHPVIFDNIDFGIDMDSRICVVGPNGAGKSTLLKLLTGEVEATKGEVRRNPRLRMGIYNQHFVDRLPMNKTPVQHLRDRFEDEDYQSVRNRLGKYGLEGHAHEVVMRDLSGGQKARVVFVELSLQRPHILLLDEPTNNLDIETIDALIDAVNEFNGGIVVVTHDQRLIENCDCELWVVEKQAVTKWSEGFDDYKETLLAEMEEHVAREAAARKEKLEAAANARAEKMARLLASKNKK